MKYVCISGPELNSLSASITSINKKRKSNETIEEEIRGSSLSAVKSDSNEQRDSEDKRSNPVSPPRRFLSRPVLSLPLSVLPFPPVSRFHFPISPFDALETEINADRESSIRLMVSLIRGNLD